MAMIRSFRRGFATVAKSAPASTVSTINDKKGFVQPTSSDITIVGGGPAGLTLLAALKNSRKTRHLKCTLIDTAPLADITHFNSNPPDVFTNRVSSLTPASISYLEQIGSWGHVNEDRVKYFDNIVAYDGISDSKIEFESFDIAAMCENSNLVSSLLTRIKELDDSEGTQEKARIIEKTKVVDIQLEQESSIVNWPIVSLSNGEKIKTRLLIGADGFNSPVRTFAGIDSRGYSYNRFGVVATLKLKYEEYRSTAWQRFIPNGPVAFLPLPNDNASLVWSTTQELSQLFTKLPPKILVAMINASLLLQDADMQYYYKHLLANPTDETLIDDINWRISKIPLEIREEKYPMEVVDIVPNSVARFPLKISHADTYVSDRIALVGDAAHTSHPLAGQGLNMGQGDVQSLVAALEKGVDRGLDIGSSLVLEPYFSERYPKNHFLLSIIDKLHWIYNTDLGGAVWARSLGVNVLDRLDVAKDFMIKHITGR